MHNLVMMIAFLICSLNADAKVNLTQEAKDLKLRREMTGLGFSHEVTVAGVLEFVKSKRGAQGPIFQDEEKPQQLVLIDAQGVRWTSETDGGVVELRDERGRIPLVYETKTDWFKFHEIDRMLLSLESLITVKARPDYRYGGGHIKIRLKPHFEDHPLQFASLVNLFLNYEPILGHLMAHKRRVENAKPLTFSRMDPGQLARAGLPRDARTTLAQYLGEGLNDIIKGNFDCRNSPSVKKHFDLEQRSNLSLIENCVLAWLAHFATDVVGQREYGINLQAWRGPNPARLKKSIELRFLNAPTTASEALLEEALVRAMADQAIRAGSKAILYAERVDPSYDLDSFYNSYYPDRRAYDFGELLQSSGFDAKEVQVYFDEYLSDSKWTRRRSTF